MVQNLGTYYCFFPVRDGERTVAQVMDSLLVQTYRPSKIIAVNDGSTDRTGEILAQYEEKHPDVVEVVNTGSTTRDYKRIPLLWNMSLRREYDYHMIAAGDVSFSPDYSEKILSAMKRNTEMVICSGDYGGARSVAPHGAGRFVRQSFFYDNYDEYPHVVGYESEILERALLGGKKISVVHDATFDHLDRLGHSHNFVEFGYAMKALGYYAPYVIGRCVKDFFENGQVGRRGAWNMFYYYVTFRPKAEGYFSLFPEDIRRGIRERQKKMMMQAIRRKIVFAAKE